MTTTPAALSPIDRPTAPAAPAPADKAGNGYVWLLIIATFGVFMAFVTPLAISLAIRLDDLAPGHAEYLGYITGVGALAALVTSAFVGMFSDRTRSRLGRRRPWLIAGSTMPRIAP